MGDAIRSDAANSEPDRKILDDVDLADELGIRGALHIAGVTHEVNASAPAKAEPMRRSGVQGRGKAEGFL